MGDHIRLTTLDSDCDIVEILNLAVPPCHSSSSSSPPPCHSSLGGANASSKEHSPGGDGTEEAHIEKLTQLVGELSKQVSTFLSNNH